MPSLVETETVSSSATLTVPSSLTETVLSAEIVSLSPGVTETVSSSPKETNSGFPSHLQDHNHMETEDESPAGLESSPLSALLRGDPPSSPFSFNLSPCANICESNSPSNTEVSPTNLEWCL